MNPYTFVTKTNNQVYPEPGKQTSSILQRLQHLKQSMRPSQSLQKQYESINSNMNPSQSQYHRLNKYLPRQSEQNVTNKNNEEGTEEFQSYRKSLQKKLNYLFDKQKRILKAQQPYRFQKYGLPQQNITREVDKNFDDLETKYIQFKQEIQSKKADTNLMSRQIKQTRSFSNINPINEIYQQRQFRAQTTMADRQANQFLGLGLKQNLQIEQMERKIKMLEMKYLGNFQDSPEHMNLEKVSFNHNNQTLDKQIPLPKKQKRSKLKKFQGKKDNTSPDRFKINLNTSYKQTIQSSKKQPSTSKDSKVDKKLRKITFQESQKTLKQFVKSPQKERSFNKNERKQPIKQYMNTIDHHNSQSNMVEGQSMLHKQFYELKNQFETLLNINKEMVGKIEINEEERSRKRENKQKAKAMLKQILAKLQQIKYEIKNQPKSSSKSFRTAEKSKKKINPYPEKFMQYEKSSLFDLKKSNKKLIFSKNYTPEQNQNQKQLHSTNEAEVNKLKNLLKLEKEHRKLIEKKFQVVCSKDPLLNE